MVITGSDYNERRDICYKRMTKIRMMSFLVLDRETKVLSIIRFEHNIGMTEYLLNIV